MTGKVWATPEPLHAEKEPVRLLGCVICRKALGQKGDSPAITIDVYNPAIKQRKKAKAHQNCARNSVGLK